MATTIGDALDSLVREARTTGLSEATVRARRSDVHAITAYLDGGLDRDVASLTVHDLRVAFAAFAGAHAQSSVVRARSTWRRLYDLLVEEGVVPGSVMTTVAARAKAPPRYPKPLNGWERGVGAELLAGTGLVVSSSRSAWPARDRAVIGTLLTTGIRSAEIAGLSLGSVVRHRDGSSELVVLGKGRKQRVIPLAPSTQKVIDLYLAERAAEYPLWSRRDGDPLFVARPIRSHGDEPEGGGRMSTHQIAYLVQRVATQSGLSGALPAGASVHALRHTFGSTLARRGEPLHHIAAVMGHASISTTQGYLAPMTSDLLEALEDNAEDLGL